MARIRTIKPEFFTSEDIVSLSFPARLLYIALWCEADRDGRLVWKPLTFKIRYFPVDDVDVIDLCSELVDKGLIELYLDNYAVIPSFYRHQNINPRETASVLPAPLSIPRVSDASPKKSDAQQGKSRKGKESNKRVTDGNNDFEKFWAAYPRKDSKVQAEKAFAKLAPDEQTLTEILAGVGRAVTSEQWRKDEGKFIPYASTWLNQRRWEDGGTRMNGHTPSLLSDYDDLMRGAI
jgi:hypothetical protein